MEAAAQDSSSGTWRLGFLHLAWEKAWILDREEARGDVRREPAGLKQEWGQWLGCRCSSHNGGGERVWPGTGPGHPPPRPVWKGSSTQELTRPKCPRPVALSCTRVVDGPP